MAQWHLKHKYANDFDRLPHFYHDKSFEKSFESSDTRSDTRSNDTDSYASRTQNQSAEESNVNVETSRSSSSSGTVDALNGLQLSSRNRSEQRNDSKTSMIPFASDWSRSDPSSRSKNTNHKGTSSSSSSKSYDRSTIVSIVEGRALAKGEVGFAAIDLYSATLVLSQFGDGLKYPTLISKCQMFNPFEIIMPNTICKDTETSSLYRDIITNFPTTKVTPVERQYFNDSKGLEWIRDLCCPEYATVDIEIQVKYYCLSAAAALLKYIEFIKNSIFINKSLKVVYQVPDNKMMIDHVTVKSLELIVNLLDPKNNVSLFGVINHTQTRSGFRLLRSNILQPSIDLQLIESRLNIVSEILENDEMFKKLKDILNRFGIVDLEHLMSFLVQYPKNEDVRNAEQKIENIIYLKHVLTLIEPLKYALKDCDNDALKDCVNQLTDKRFDAIMKEINNVIDSECRYVNGALNIKKQKCFAIKSNINPLLEVAREAYNDTIDDIDQLVNGLTEKYNISFKTGYTVSRGFHVQMNTCDMKKLPERSPKEFMKVSKSKNIMHFTTEEIVKRNNRIRLSTEEIYLMSNAIITELMIKIRDHIGCLHRLTDVVANLDLLMSFAHHAAYSQNYVRPDFSDSLVVRNGKHPILEHIARESSVPNNSYITEDHNFVLITGPNMSGKSTYLKQVAVLQVMAQIGSFVPATFASFRMTDRIFSRIGSNDDFGTNCSTFMMEMREAAYIMKNITENSLIIIDEIGRGTSVEEGVGLAWAIAEYFINTKAFTLFASHFLQLSKLEQLYFNVHTYHLKVDHITDGNNQSVHFTHEVERGVTREEFYGLQIAEMTSLKKEIVENAKAIAHRLKQQQKTQLNVSSHISASSESSAAEDHALYNIGASLVQLRRRNEIPDHDYLLLLKQTYFKDRDYFKNAFAEN